MEPLLRRQGVAGAHHRIYLQLFDDPAAEKLGVGALGQGALVKLEHGDVRVAGQQPGDVGVERGGGEG